MRKDNKDLMNYEIGINVIVYTDHKCKVVCTVSNDEPIVFLGGRVGAYGVARVCVGMGHDLFP